MLVVVLFFLAFLDNLTFLVVVCCVCVTLVLTLSNAFAWTLTGAAGKQQILRSNAVTAKNLLNPPFGD